MRLRIALLLLTAVLPGAAAVLVSGWFLLLDWAALRRAFAQFDATAASDGDLRAVMVADAYQSAYRINCFADGVGVLLGALLLAIGVHGLCLLATPLSSKKMESP